jgi:hypothetical protein
MMTDNALTIGVSISINKGTAYIEQMAPVIGADRSVGVGDVLVVPCTDHVSLQEGILSAILARHGPLGRECMLGVPGRKSVWRVAGYRTWKRYAEGTAIYSIVKGPDYYLHGWSRAVEGGFLTTKDMLTRLEGGTDRANDLAITVASQVCSPPSDAVMGAT